jgi:hypothetical protein
MSLEDVVAMLLDGSTGLGEILGDFQDHHEMVRIAVAALKVTDDLQAVSEAMTARGLHPLSLLCSGGADLQAWITENPDREKRFYANQRWPRSGCHYGSFRIERLRASKWLKALQPGLKLVFGDAADTLVLSDSCLTGLLDADMYLEMNLKIMACEGRVHLPSRIRGRLQLRFNEATFHFPRHMELEGCVEIRDCPGIHRLPDELSTTLLELVHCPGVRTLPKRIFGASHIDLISLPIETFPEGVEDVSYLHIARAPKLKSLPLPSSPRLDVELVDLSALTSFRTLTPSGVRNLLATSCEMLESLPQNLTTLSGSLSDGQANEGVTDPGAQTQATADAAGKGVGTSTYGLGTGFNEALMVDLAHHGQGRCYYGESAEDLLDPFLEEFEFLAARCASDVQVALQTAPGLTVSQATNHLPSGLGAWRLPELAWSSEVWILLKVDVDATTLQKGPEGGTVLFLRTSWKDRSGVEHSLPYRPLILPLLSQEAFEALPEDPLVRRRMRELEVGMCEERAYRAAVMGDRAGVQAALDALKALGQDDAWTQERALELELLAKEADNAHLAKELYCGCSSSMGSHTRNINEETPEEKVERYLRRKKRQGKGDGSSASRNEDLGQQTGQ